ncbi:Protein of unknown function [Bacillus cereus]|nr:Protein of unknown function [Bacillus cereus]
MKAPATIQIMNPFSLFVQW